MNAIEGQVLQPMLIEAVLRTVFVADEADRPALEAERDELDRSVQRDVCDPPRDIEQDRQSARVIVSSR